MKSVFFLALTCTASAAFADVEYVCGSARGALTGAVRYAIYSDNNGKRLMTREAPLQASTSTNLQRIKADGTEYRGAIAGQIVSLVIAGNGKTSLNVGSAQYLCIKQR